MTIEISISSLVIGIIGLVLCYYLFLFARQCWLLRDFRGPYALPLVGNCYQTEALFLLRYLAKLRKRYGTNFTFFAFTKPYLVTCEPTAVRRVLSDTKTFRKGEDYTTVFSLAFGQGLVTSNGDKHKVDRAMFGKYFIRSNISKYMSTINSITSNAIVTMLPQETGEQKKPVNIEEFFAKLALRVFMGFSCTYTATPEKEIEMAHLVSKGSFEMGRMIVLGLPSWGIMPAVRYLRFAADSLWVVFQNIISERRKQLSKGEAKDIDDCLSAMIANNVSDKDMRDHMITLICAGHDTTAFFSAYMCYLLATNQDAQDKLRDEIRVTLNGKTELTADDMTEMKFLHNVMQETLRLYSIIPAVTRVATEEVHIKEANMTIPKGATVMIPLFLINRDPELWDKPSEFNPDRFEGKGDFTSAKNGFFPFGYGARTCIGNTLAQLESAVFMCHLLLKFRLKADPGFKPAIMAGISLTTSNGINVVLESL